MNNKGYLITFEGPDRTGKTTTAISLSSNLRNCGYDVLLIREPGGTELGDRIYDIVTDRDLEIIPEAELFLFSAARVQLCTQVIPPALFEGKVVLMDRFADSTSVYQGCGRGLDLRDIHWANKIATKGFTPNLTFLLDVDYEVGLKRALGRPVDRFDREKRAFWERLREGYLALSQEDPKRWTRIDANNLSKEEVAARVLELTLIKMTEAGIEPKREVSQRGKER